MPRNVYDDYDRLQDSMMIFEGCPQACEIDTTESEKEPEEPEEDEQLR